MPRRINPKLATFARQMRAAPTPLEDKLWQAVRASRLEGSKFSRQITLGGFICDFVCPNLRLVIEIDGDTHERAKDADRDHSLGRMGYRVFRFTNSEVGSNLDGVPTAILEAAKGRPSKTQPLDGVTHPPAPVPLPLPFALSGRQGRIGALGREGEL